MLSENRGADSARRGSACTKARGGKLAQEHRGPSSCSVPGSAPGRGGRAEPAGASLWAPGGGAVLGWRSGGGCRKPGALGCSGGGWCCDRSAGPAPFGNPPPSGPPPPRPRPRLRPRPAPGARSKLSDMLLVLQRGAAGAAPNRTRGRRRGPPVTAAPHSGLMEEASGSCSVLRAPGPRRRAAAQRPPPRLPPACGRSPLSPTSPARPLARPRRSGAEAGHSGPPRPGGPGRGCPPAGWRRPLAFADSWLLGGWRAGRRTGRQPRLHPAAWTSGVRASRRLR